MASTPSNAAIDAAKQLPPSTNVEVIPFSVLPPQPGAGSRGIVGTITLMNRSAIIWFGRGDLARDGSEGKNEVGETVVVGRGLPKMGPLVVSMPRSKYGRSNENDAPSSQLVGGPNEEDMVIGTQMSSRLAKKVGWPVFISCSLSGSASQEGETGIEGDEYGGTGSQVAAALAEREIGQILLAKKQSDEAKD